MSTVKWEIHRLPQVCDVRKFSLKNKSTQTEVFFTVHRKILVFVFKNKGFFIHCCLRLGGRSLKPEKKIVKTNFLSDKGPDSKEKGAIGRDSFYSAIPISISLQGKHLLNSMGLAESR